MEDDLKEPKGKEAVYTVYIIRGSCGEHRHGGDGIILLPELDNIVTPIFEVQIFSTNGCSKVGHMEGLRRQLSKRDISEKAGELILALWQSKTNANYNSSWRKWEEWCKPRDIHPFSSEF